MLRVAAWTGGLFAIGAGVAHYFPGSWTEPLVLAALGATMLLLGGREPARRPASFFPQATKAPSTLGASGAAPAARRPRRAVTVR